MKKSLKAISIAAAILAVGSAADAQELKNINYMSSNNGSCGQFVQFAMQAFGYLEKDGYKVTLLDSDTSVPYVAFLANGDADLVLLDAAQVLNAREAGQDIKVVYEAYQYGPEGIVVLADSPVTSLAELKGKTIGLAEQSDEITTQIALDSVGVRMNEVTTFVVGNQGPIMAKALQDGQVDAFAGGSGDRAALEALGVQFRNITPDAVSRNPGNSIAVWGPTLEEKRPLIQAFLRAWAQSQDASLLDTKAVAAMCATYVPEQFEKFNVGMNLINLQTYTLQIRRTFNYGDLQPDVWAAIQPGFLKAGVIKQQIDPATFLDTSFQAGIHEITTDMVKEGIQQWKDANPDKVIN
jgi:NitT/TauT family transport system substrate-binding protein